MPRLGPPNVRILVEPSDYVLRNAGDMAMLHVAVTRLSSLWPAASIQVLSDTPDLLPGTRQTPGRWLRRAAGDGSETACFEDRSGTGSQPGILTPSAV